METIRNGGSFQGGKTAVGSEDSTGVMSLKGQVASVADSVRMCVGVLEDVRQRIETVVYSFGMILNPSTVGALLNTHFYRHSQLMSNQLEPVRCAVVCDVCCEKERWDK